MSYYGDIRLGDTIDVKFSTIQVSGAPTTLSGSPVISAYVGNSTTQLTAGITLSVDFDSVTGLNNVRVVATSGNGYTTASNYDLIITTGTVNSVSVVGYKVASFSIEARSALMPITAARTADVDASGRVLLQPTQPAFTTTSWGGFTSSQLFDKASYTAPDNASVTGIKAKTDSLTFTVTGQVDSNVQYVNDTQVKGAGTVPDPWNPV